MMLELTQRDKKLLIGLGFFCLVTVLFFGLILPLQSANREWNVQIAASEERIQELQMKRDSLTELEMEYENRRKRLEELQNGLYPMLDDCEVDRLLTEKAGALQLHIQRMEIGKAVPCSQEEAFDSGEGEAEGVCLVRVRMEIEGSYEKIRNLLDVLGAEEPGIRVAGFTWTTDGETISGREAIPDGENISGREGAAEGMLSIQLEILMCRKEEEKE